MKIVSFNCNGLRSVLTKDENGKKETDNPHVLQKMIQDYDPDILCLQETRCDADFVTNLSFENYRILDSKTKKGYSGVAIFSKVKPLEVLTNFSENEEGRCLVFEYPKFFIVNIYVPNSKADLSRLDYRIDVWEKKIRNYIKKLEEKKSVIVVGDMNVAHKEIDLHNPKSNKNSHGFTQKERTAFQLLLDECNLIDSFRFMYPYKKEYSWFSNFRKSRERNVGWRVDYCLVQNNLKNKIQDAAILSQYKGSDHVMTLLDIIL